MTASSVPASGTDAAHADEEVRASRAAAFARLSKVMLGIFVGLAALDLALTVLGDESGAQGNTSVMVLDPELGWTNRSRHAEEGLTTDTFGLRNPEIPANAPLDEARILVAGDSNTFGLFERDADTWGPKLEALLARAGTPPPRVLNAGVQGYSIIQSCRRAARLIDAVEPDLVVVVVIPGRQGLVDTSPAEHWTRVGDHIVPTALVEAWPRALRGVVAGIHRTLLHSSLYRRQRARAQFREGVGPGLTEFVLTHAASPAPIRDALERTRREIEQLVAYAASKGVVLRFAPTLDNRNTNPDQWRSYLEFAHAHGGPPLATPMTEPLEALTRFIHEAGGATWDMHEVLFAIGSDWSANVNPQLHWSAAGHTLIAEDWARKLLDSGLLSRLVAARRDAPRAVEDPMRGDFNSDDGAGAR